MVRTGTRLGLGLSQLDYIIVINNKRLRRPTHFNDNLTRHFSLSVNCR